METSDYRYDPQHQHQPEGSGWMNTSKGWYNPTARAARIAKMLRSLVSSELIARKLTIEQQIMEMVATGLQKLLGRHSSLDVDDQSLYISFDVTSKIEHLFHKDNKQNANFIRAVVKKIAMDCKSKLGVKPILDADCLISDGVLNIKVVLHYVEDDENASKKADAG